MDTMTGLKRTAYCGAFRAGDVGKEAVVCGWAARQRDLGSLIFIDLRDRTGVVQLAFDEQTDRAVFDKAFAVRSEFVLAAKGVVRERSSKNPELPTGDVEIFVTELRVLAKSETPPFDIVENCQTAELTRLKYRYLDLRRPDLQQNLLFRHKVTKIARAMVMQYGMSDKIGMINYDDNGDDVFLGYDIAHSKNYSNEMLSLIDNEVQGLVDECYAAAKELIMQHNDVLERSCELLLEKEKLTGEEFAALF